MPGYIRTVRSLSRDARLSIASWALSAFGTAGVDNVLGNLFVLRLGYGPGFLGQMNALILAGMGLASLPGSELGRRFGCRRAMLGGLIVGALGLSLVPATVLVPAWLRPAWITAAYVIAYAAITVRSVNSAPFMMKATLPEQRNHAFSVQNALMPAGAFLGSVAAGLLPGAFALGLGFSADSPNVYALSILVGAVTLVPALIAIAATREPAVKCPADQAQAEASATPGSAPLALILPMAGVMALRAASDASLAIFFNIYLDERLAVPTALIGALMATGRLVTVPASLLAPLAIARLGRSRTFLVATLATAAALVPIATVPRWEAAALSYVLIMGLLGLGNPAVAVFHQSLVAQRWRSTMSGAVTMGSMVGMSAMVSGSGYVIEKMGYGMLFGLTVALTAASAVFFWLYFRRRNPEAAGQPAS